MAWLTDMYPDQYFFSFMLHPSSWNHQEYCSLSHTIVNTIFNLHSPSADLSFSVFLWSVADSILLLWCSFSFPCSSVGGIYAVCHLTTTAVWCPITNKVLYVWIHENSVHSNVFLFNFLWQLKGKPRLQMEKQGENKTNLHDALKFIEEAVICWNIF